MGVDNTSPVQYTGGVPAYVPPPVTAPHYPPAAATTTTSSSSPSSNRPQYAPGPPRQPQYAPPAAVSPPYAPSSGTSPYPPQQQASSSPYSPQYAPPATTGGCAASPYPPQTAPYPPLDSPYPPSTAPSAQDAGVDQFVDDDFVLVNDVPAKRPCDDPAFLPPPTAPPAPSQPQPPGNPSVAQAYATVSAAIVADKSGNIEEAVSKFKSGIALLNWCDRQGLFPKGDVEGIHHRVRQYQSRLDELERNARYAQPHQAAKKPAKAAATAAAAKPAQRPSGGAGFGWDGTGFSGSRRRQLDTALELREQAELFLERGKLLEAKGRLMGCAEALLAFASTETDAKLKREVRKEAEDIIDQAEMLQDEKNIVEEAGTRLPRQE